MKNGVLTSLFVAVLIGMCSSLLMGCPPDASVNFRVEPLRLEFGNVTQGTQPSSMIFWVEAEGGAISWTASTWDSWLTVEPLQGSLNAGQRQRVTVTCSLDALNPGDYNGNIGVIPDRGSSKNVNVHMMCVERNDGEGEPTANFTMNKASGEAPLIVQFEDLSTAGTADITRWAWSFGDSNSGTANSDTFQNPGHTFNDAGSYDITLTVTTAHGSDDITKQVSVAAAAGTPVVINQNVRVVDDISTLSLDTASGDDYTFTYSGNGAPPVQPGDILIGTDGDGYLRKVSSVKSIVTKKNGTKSATISTEFAAINEAVETGTLELDAPIQFAADDFAKSGLKMAKAGTTIIDLTDMSIIDKPGLSVTITSGTVDFAPSMDVQVEWESALPTYVKAAGTGTFTLDFAALAELGAIDFDTADPATLDDFFGTDHLDLNLIPPVKIQFYGQVGPLPVKGKVTLSFVAGLRIHTESALSVEAGFSSTTAVTIGGEFVKDADPELSNISDFSLSAEAYGPTWDVDINGKVRVYVQPQLQVSFYGVAAPFLGLEPYEEFSMDLIPEPAHAELTAGLDGYLGFKLGILAFDWLTKTWTLKVEGPSYIIWPQEVGTPDLDVDASSV
jgi:PKD repeat protein